MFLRVLLIAVVTLISSTASAQKTRRDIRTKFPTAPTGQVTLDPNSPAAPLMNLPALPGQTWRHWIVPGLKVIDTSLKRATYSIHIVNVGNLPLTAKMECYTNMGNSMIKVSKYLKAHSVALVKSTQGWCRVSADKPIFVYGEEVYTEYIFNHKNLSSKNTTYSPTPAFYTKIIPAYPYPAK